jgi:outer membrane protein assembly factor BamB
VDGSRLVVTPGGAEDTLVALNKSTGDVVWKSAVPGGDNAGYASIVVADVGGRKHYVQFVEKGLVGVDAESGKFLWRYDKTAQGSPANIPTPVVHNGYVYSATGRGGAALIKLVPDGEAVKVEEVYFGKKYPTAIGGAVVVKDHLYGTTGSAMMCVEWLTGTEKWSERGIGAGAVLFADGCLYVHGENGDVALAEATPDAYREKGRFSPPGQPNRGQSKAWAYPVVANGRLYVRDIDTVWCYDVKDPNAVN